MSARGFPGEPFIHPFDLNEAIRQWRQKVGDSPAIGQEALGEMESHLVDAVQALLWALWRSASRKDGLVQHVGSGLRARSNSTAGVRSRRRLKACL